MKRGLLSAPLPLPLGARVPQKAQKGRSGGGRGCDGGEDTPREKVFVPLSSQLSFLCLYMTPRVTLGIPSPLRASASPSEKGGSRIIIE